MTQLTPEELLRQLQAFNADSNARVGLSPELSQSLAAAARETSYKVQTPSDTLARLLLCQPIEGASIHVAVDLKLFSILADSNKPKSLDHLVHTTKADPVLLPRILRSLVAVHAVEQSEDGLYSLAPSHSLLADPKLANVWSYCYDFLGDNYRAMPQFLASKGYINPTDLKDTVAQFAHKAPGKSTMDILLEHPIGMRGFGTLMSIWADGWTQIETLYPVHEKLITGFDKAVSDVMFVDVGGGFGQKSVAFARAFPDQPGRVVVQDLPVSIENAPKDEDRYAGVELTVHDFTTEQPIKDARCYYLRKVLHDWPDEMCITILGRLKDSMKEGYSKILIHDVIMPEGKASTWATSQDLEMLCTCAALERTEYQWRELCSKAGLRVVDVHRDNNFAAEGIVEVEI